MEFKIPAMKLHTESTEARLSGLYLHLRPASLPRCIALLSAAKQNNSNHSLLDSLNSSLHSYTSHENFLELATDMTMSLQQQNGSSPEITPPQSDSSYEDTSRALNKLATVVENIFARMRVTIEDIHVVFDCAVNRAGDEVGLELVVDRLSLLDQTAADQAAVVSAPQQQQQPQPTGAAAAASSGGNNQLRKNIELSGVRLFFRRAVSPPPSDIAGPHAGGCYTGAGSHMPHLDSVLSSVASSDNASFYSVRGAPTSARPLLSPIPDSSICVPSPSASASASSSSNAASDDVRALVGSCVIYSSLLYSLVVFIRIDSGLRALATCEQLASRSHTAVEQQQQSVSPQAQALQLLEVFDKITADVVLSYDTPQPHAVQIFSAAPKNAPLHVRILIDTY